MTTKPPGPGKGNHPNSRAQLAAHKKEWKKGEVSNPWGRWGRDPVLHGLKNLTKKEFRDILTTALRSDMDSLEAIADNPRETAIRAGVARALHGACKRGDWIILERALTHLIGAPPTRVDVTSDGKPLEGPRVLFYLPNNGRTKEEIERQSTVVSELPASEPKEGGTDDVDLGF